MVTPAEARLGLLRSPGPVCYNLCKCQSLSLQLALAAVKLWAGAEAGACPFALWTHDMTVFLHLIHHRHITNQTYNISQTRIIFLSGLISVFVTLHYNISLMINSYTELSHSWALLLLIPARVLAEGGVSSMRMTDSS